MQRARVSHAIIQLRQDGIDAPPTEDIRYLNMSWELSMTVGLA
jgi:hypothetical protein